MTAAELGLVFLGVLLFTLSFPSFLSDRGWAFLGFFALLPIFYLIPKISWTKTVLYGGLYGWSSYALFNFWLITFNPVAFSVVPTVYLLYGMALFPLLKAATLLLPHYRPWILTLVWVSYEFLKTQGFLGYSYGVLGYVHWENPLLIQLASLGGVWPLSFLTVFPSAFLAELLATKKFDKRLKIGLGIYSGLMVLSVIWGVMSPLETKNLPHWKTALIQNDMDPWIGGDEGYSQGLQRLTFLSTAAAREKPEAIIWPETSFVPSIFYHKKYREDPLRYQLVVELENYLKSSSADFILGNGHGERRLIPGKGGQSARVDYNSSFLYSQGQFTQRYDKIHLVPFTENFPFRGPLTPVYEYLKNADTHFWEAGRDYTVFTLPGVKFSTPICFEDTFGSLNREFVLQGAQVLVNLSNDSWSGVKTNMYQHFAIGVFRAVENRRSLLRSTAGGITASVDPNGKILGELSPYTQGYLMAEVPLVTEVKTLYTLWGDWMAYFMVILTLVGLGYGVWGLVRKIS